jgi:pyridoxine 5-phosphate synthase
VTRLHVNVDHVATVRNARGTQYPDPSEAGAECLRAGADGLTAHLREDRRHIVESDVERLCLVTRAESRVFNLEMAATEAMTAFAVGVRPDVCTLVPERREELTTEGGLDVVAGGRDLAQCIERLRAAGIRVSLFVAPDERQIDAARAVGANQVELHTGEYAHGRSGELERLERAGARVRTLGLALAAGHGLTLANVGAVAALPWMDELNIGHAIVSDAIFRGIGGAVKAYLSAIGR